EMLALPVDRLAEVLKNTRRGARGYALICKDDKMANNFRTNMLVYVGGLEYMSESTGGFTIREWLDTKKEGFIFVTNYSNIKTVLKPVLSLFIDLLARELLSMSEDYNRRVYFFLDEFGTLQNLNSITELLTQSRSKGGSVWIGIQDQGQIEAIYGKEGRQSIVSSCGGNLVFSVADPDTSEYLSRKIGDQEFYETETSHSMGPGDDRDGISLAKRRQTGRLILPSQIQNLKDLNFYLKVPGFDITQTRLEYKGYEKINAPFMLRDGLDINEIFEKQNEAERAIDALFLPRGQSHDDSNGLS
ncbi:MAG: type IV secretion system DNA-binding domain-containing protein, partial [Deltaproteobacteria bacterium]|nr:type IV secretion system DNA-binding domain-containing protein [Deltaproteobacteria bacterium]